MLSLADIGKRFKETKDNNIFATAFAHVLRDWRFLEIIHRRYLEASKLFFEKGRPQAIQADGAEVWSLHERAVAIQDELHLEIESFYIFADILLDKVAQAIGQYFGQVREVSLKSYKDLVKGFPTFATRQELLVPEGFEKMRESCRSYWVSIGTSM